MVVHRRLLVLANSMKHSGRCIAGRELLVKGAEVRVGRWLRPVALHGQGELREAEYLYPDHSPVAVLDVAEVALDHPISDPYQPENWCISGTAPWRKCSVDGLRPAIDDLVETPANLWLQPGEHSDRVSHDYLAKHPPQQSLAIVRPTNLRIWLSLGGWEGAVKHRRRCLFTYHGTQYDMGLTDPTLIERYADRFPGLHDPPVEIRLPCGDPAAVCVSLAGAYHGYHYKVVATVFESTASTPAFPAPGVPAARLFTVGHSNQPMEALLASLALHGITAVADVRSSPFSRFNPQYNCDSLAKALEAAGIRYVPLGVELGARRTEPECYEAGKARYERIARTPLFRKGLDRIRLGLAKYRIALLCAEKDPITCHRTILVCRNLRNDISPIHHILEGGGIETHAAAEARLLALCGLPENDLFLSRDELVEQAYVMQGERLAYVAAADMSEEGQ